MVLAAVSGQSTDRYEERQPQLHSDKINRLKGGPDALSRGRPFCCAEICALPPP